MVRKIKNRLRINCKTIIYILSIAFEFNRGFIFVFFLNTIISSIAPFVLIVFPKYLIDELMGARRIGYLSLIVTCIVALNFLLKIMIDILSCKREKYTDRFKQYFNFKIAHKISKMDYVDLEKSDIMKMKENAISGIDMAGGIDGLINSILSIITNLLRVIGLIYILFIVNPILIVILGILVIVNGKIDQKKQNTQYEFWTKNSDNNRRQSYFSSLVRDYTFAKDIRLFDMSHFLLKKYRQADEKSNEFLKNVANSEFEFSRLSNLLNGGQIFIIYAFMLYKLFVNTQSFTVGSFIMCSNAIKEFSDTLNELVRSLMRIEFSCQYFEEFRQFMDLPCQMRKGKLKVEIKPDSKIEFKDVWFKYPGSDDYVIRDLNIVLSCSDKIAIVGENGAGKTTFIKLLLRLYNPTKGVIRIDGVDIKEIDYEYYMSLFSTVFQDYSIFAFSVLENIVFENNDMDDEKVQTIKKMKILEKYSQLPNDLKTIVTKEFDESGVNFSGGELQNIAFARALYKDSSIFIFDEPTAAMDAISEENIYGIINESIDRKMVLFISHRLASCKFCDKILVFDEGRIIQEGNHQKLLNGLEGKYRRLFEAQAKYYQ